LALVQPGTAMQTMRCRKRRVSAEQGARHLMRRRMKIMLRARLLKFGQRAGACFRLAVAISVWRG